MTRVVAVNAGLSDSSTTRLLAERLGAAVAERAPGTSVESVSLREHAHDITDATLTGFAGPALQHVYDTVAQADALIAVSPIYKASYTGLFKSFFDAMEPELVIGKPVLLGATGGTARHSLAIESAMRPLVAYLQAFAMPTGVFAAPHDWGADGEVALDGRIARAAAEIVSVLDGAGTGRTHADEIDLFSATMRSISGDRRP